MQYDRPVSRNARELISVCDHLAYAACVGSVWHQLDAAGRERYDEAQKLIENDTPHQRRAGFVMFLDLLLDDPYALVAAVDHLRAQTAAVELEPSEEERRRFEP